MNKYYILSVLCFIFGVILIGYGIARGEGTIYWAIIFPIFTGSGITFIFGSLLLILGFITMIIGFISGSYELVDAGEISLGDFIREPGEDYRTRSRKKLEKRPTKIGKERPGVEPRQRPQTRPRGAIKTGGVIFVGPIPIIWGSDRKIAYAMAIVSVVLVMIFLIFALAWLL